MLPVSIRDFGPVGEGSVSKRGPIRAAVVTATIRVYLRLFSMRSQDPFRTRLQALLLKSDWLITNQPARGRVVYAIDAF